VYPIVTHAADSLSLFVLEKSRTSSSTCVVVVVSFFPVHFGIETSSYAASSSSALKATFAFAFHHAELVGALAVA
jgi:hypothetical protein